MNLCQYCGYLFATPSSLRRHISARHSSETSDREQRKTKHQCPQCHAYFARHETVERHVRNKHEGDLSACSFCLKKFRADYMPQHRAICARKYWRKVQQQCSSLDDSTSVAQGASRSYSSRPSIPEVPEEHVQLLDKRDKRCTLRIVREMTVDDRLAEDALTRALSYFLKTKDVESYKSSLVTAVRLNIAVRFVGLRANATGPFSRLVDLERRVNQLICGDIQINQTFESGKTILHKACAAGVSDMLEPLFWRGARFDVTDVYSNTPLIYAMESGSIDTVRFALALGSDPNLECPLSLVRYNGSHDIIALLLKHGADVNKCVCGTTLLSAAIKNRDLERVRLALSFGADPNLGRPMDYLIADCLFEGCRDCIHAEMAGLLIQHGADVSRSTDIRITIFHFATIKGHVQLLRTALERLTSPAILNFQDFESGRTALHHINALSGTVPLDRSLVLTSMLLEAGADVNVQDRRGETALILAAREGGRELVRLLLDAGAAVQIQSYHGRTALSYAAERGHSTIVGLLLERVAPSHEDSSYLTLALKEAVEGDHHDIVKQLISFGADSSAREVLSLALKSSTSEVVRILVEAGARFYSVQPQLIAELFAARNEVEVAGGLIPAFVEAAAKCELLLLAFPQFWLDYA